MRRPVVRLGDIDRRIEKKLKGQRRVERDELPFDQPSLGEREIGDMAPGLVEVRALEDDDDAGLIGAGIVLADDPGLPQPPDVGDLIAEIGLP